MVSVTIVLILISLYSGVWCRIPNWQRHFERRFNNLEKKVYDDSLEFRDELLYLHEKINDNDTAIVCSSHDKETTVTVKDDFKDSSDTAVTNDIEQTILTGLREEKEYVRRSLSEMKDMLDERQGDLADDLEVFGRSLRDEVSNVERSLTRDIAATKKDLFDENTSHLKTLTRLDNEISSLNKENAKLKENAAADKTACDRNILDMKMKYETDITSIKAGLKEIKLNFAKKAKQICGSWHSFKKSCYIFITKPATWEEAGNTCLSLGAYLAEVDDEDENIFLKELAKQSEALSGTYGPWLGASDLDEEGTWRWSYSGRNVDDVYRGWRTYEPNGRSKENCLHLYKQARFKWNDARCTHKNGFICEK